MTERIKVSTFHPTGRKFYHAQWRDPLTGKLRTVTTKETTKRDAERFALTLEAELNDGQQITGRITWAEVCRQYRDAIYPAQRKSTKAKTETTIAAIDKHLKLHWANKLTATDILQFCRELRKERELSEYTVKGHLAELRKILRWAHRHRLLAEVPQIEMPKVKTHAKGRAPTQEEFERMLKKAEAIVGKDAAPSWQDTLKKFWWSGLRLSEGESLRWTNDGTFWVDIEAEPPMFHMAAGLDKGVKDRVFPVAREFAEMLRQVPKKARRGYVFTPMPWGESDPNARPSSDRIGKTIRFIGKAATVKVAERKRGGKAIPQYCGTHDLRRAFGVRWAARVLPPVLMELMRHESIQTTMQFYVGRNAAMAATQAWQAASLTKTEMQSSGAADS